MAGDRLAAHRLAAHLRTWLGRWPGDGPGLTVVGSAARTVPGWDGRVHPLVGVSVGGSSGPAGLSGSAAFGSASSGSGVAGAGAAGSGGSGSAFADPGPAGPPGPAPGAAGAGGLAGSGVLSVPPGTEAAVEAVLAAGDRRAVPAAAGLSGRWFSGVFRWSTSPAPLPDAGEWVAAADPSVPEWLHPFGEEVLVARDPATGEHLAGVGIKRHDPYGWELAVVTAEAARGRGLARRLVAQAARRVLDEGAVPTYLHDRSNIGSAKVAAAAGFPDLGWLVHGLAEG